MIGSELKRYSPNQRYTVADMESEGLNLFFDRPWEVAYMVCDANNVYEKVVECIWWPDLHVSPGAAAKTRFDYKAYKEKALPADEVLARYEERLFDSSTLVIGHNFYFDAYMHASWRRGVGKQPDWSWMDRMIDTHCLFKAMKKGWKPDLKDYRRWQLCVQNWREKDLKSNMGYACREFKIEYDEYEAHAALYDIDRTRLLWEQLKWRVEV